MPEGDKVVGQLSALKERSSQIRQARARILEESPSANKDSYVLPSMPVSSIVKELRRSSASSNESPKFPQLRQQSSAEDSVDNSRFVHAKDIRNTESNKKSARRKKPLYLRMMEEADRQKSKELEERNYQRIKRKMELDKAKFSLAAIREHMKQHDDQIKAHQAPKIVNHAIKRSPGRQGYPAGDSRQDDASFENILSREKHEAASANAAVNRAMQHAAAEAKLDEELYGNLELDPENKPEKKKKKKIKKAKAIKPDSKASVDDLAALVGAQSEASFVVSDGEKKQKKKNDKRLRAKALRQPDTPVLMEEGLIISSIPSPNAAFPARGVAFGQPVQPLHQRNREGPNRPVSTEDDPLLDEVTPLKDAKSGSTIWSTEESGSQEGSVIDDDVSQHKKRKKRRKPRNTLSPPDIESHGNDPVYLYRHGLALSEELFGVSKESSAPLGYQYQDHNWEESILLPDENEARKYQDLYEAGFSLYVVEKGVDLPQ